MISDAFHRIAALRQAMTRLRPDPAATPVLDNLAAAGTRALDIMRREGPAVLARKLKEKGTGFARDAGLLRMGEHSMSTGTLLWHARQAARHVAQLGLSWLQGSSLRSGSVEPYTAPEEYLAHLRQFLTDAPRSTSERVIFIFSTTQSIGREMRANRPMRFALTLAGRGVPTLYSYHRWRPTEDCAPYDGGPLLQLPIDVTIAAFQRIAAADFGNKQKLFLLSAPNREAAQSIDLFRHHGWTIIYECRDDWEEFARAGQGKWYRRSFERYITRKSDAVVAVSITLKEKLETFLDERDVVHVIPNGYSDAFLEPAVMDYVEAGRPLASRDKPIIGYFGHLTPAWFDWDLILATALQHPDWRFEIIGFGAPTLSTPANVRVLGPKAHAEIAEIARAWSVAIIPFKPSRLAEGVDPIKVYEYLALGLPVVSTYMPQLSDYPYVEWYRNTFEFSALIKRALSVQVDYGAVLAFLSGRSWDDRVDQTLEVAARAQLRGESRVHS